MTTTCPECGGKATIDRDEDPPELLCLNQDCLYWEEIGGDRSGGGT